MNMLNFSEYTNLLLEKSSVEKNLHMTHVEELILTNGRTGALAAIDILRDVVSKLSGDAKSSAVITTKLDGAPAIICGIDPESKRFFVGTKGVFNKLTRKINFTVQDIKKNYPESPGLQEKLTVALQCLPKLGIRGVLQGDMMYTRNDLKVQKVDGNKSVVFRPNTITYVVPYYSELSKTILSSKMGIVFHTQYKGRTLETMKSTGEGLDISGLKKVTEVWFEDAYVKDISNISFDEQETADMMESLRQAQSLLSQIQFSVLENPKLNQYLLQYGSYVATNDIRDPSAQGLIDYFQKTYKSKEVDVLKTEKGRARKAALMNDLTRILETRKQTITNYFKYQSYLLDVKYKVLEKLNQTSKLGTFVTKDGALVPTAPEGFVAISKGQSVKLVDRFEFSKNNFTLQKNWA